MQLKFTSCASTALAIIQGVIAGEGKRSTPPISKGELILRMGTIVMVCIDLSKNPTQPFMVDFTIGSDEERCMEPRGIDNSLQVEHAGLSCVSLGHVRETREGQCFFRVGTWGLSFNSTGYSGSTLSTWDSERDIHELELHGSSPGTYVCPSQARCYRTTLKWRDRIADSIIYVRLAPIPNQ